MIDISKYDRADVLAALYNNSKPQGMGILHFDPEDMGREEARELLEKYTYFDYLKGRVMKARLDCDEFNPAMYDRDIIWSMKTPVALQFLSQDDVSLSLQTYRLSLGGDSGS